MNEVKTENKRGITNSTLKLIAITAMLIDHIGAVILEPIIIQSYSHGGVVTGNLLQINNVMRLLIGRIAFPIFCFLLVEGFTRTGNVWKYAGRLLLFALISEIPFNLALCDRTFDTEYQNVFFTLLLGLVVMIFTDKVCKNCRNRMVRTALCLLTVAVGMLLAEWLRTDYAAYGVLCIAVLYFCRKERKQQMIAGTLAFIGADLIMNGSTSELLAPLGFLAAAHYNGERGYRMKYVFYLFYPLHLLVLYGIRLLVL